MIKRLINFIKYLFYSSSIDNRLDKLEKDRKRHIKHLASRQNEVEQQKRKIITLAEKVAEDAKQNEKIIRGYEESIEIERGKLRVANEMISNMALVNSNLSEHVKANTSYEVARQVSVERPTERGE